MNLIFNLKFESDALICCLNYNTVQDLIAYVVFFLRSKLLLLREIFSILRQISS